MPDDQTRYIGEKAPDYKVVFADGVYTWLGGETGTINFFYDVLPDKMLDNEGMLDIDNVKRIFPVEIRMRRSTYVNLIEFMTEQLKLMEESEGKKPNKKQK
jgi:hypothetical protein